MTKVIEIAHENRPANVPQQYANQATHARYAAHARTFFLSDFVSIENKGSKIQIPKLDVAGSIPVARSRFPYNTLGFNEIGLPWLMPAMWSSHAVKPNTSAGRSMN